MSVLKCFWMFLCFALLPSLWAQTQEKTIHPGRYLTPQHRMANLLSKEKRANQPVGHLAPAGTSDKSKTWDLGISRRNLGRVARY